MCVCVCKQCSLLTYQAIGSDLFWSGLHEMGRAIIYLWFQHELSSNEALNPKSKLKSPCAPLSRNKQVHASDSQTVSYRYSDRKYPHQYESDGETCEYLHRKETSHADLNRPLPKSVFPHRMPLLTTQVDKESQVEALFAKQHVKMCITRVQTTVRVPRTPTNHYLSPATLEYRERHDERRFIYVSTKIATSELFVVV